MCIRDRLITSPTPVIWKPVESIGASANHLSVDSFHKNCLLVLSPLSISIPASSDGVPVASLLRTIMLSPVETVVELTVVVVPLTVKLPETTMSSLNVLSPPTVCVPVVLTTELSRSKLLALAVIPSPPTTFTTPEEYVKPSPALPGDVDSVNEPAASS